MTRNSTPRILPNVNGLTFREWLLRVGVAIRTPFEMELRAKKYTRRIRKAWADGEDPAIWASLRRAGLIDNHGRFAQGLPAGKKQAP